MEKFHYYVFLDYSENLVGYIIIENNQVEKIIPLISKLKHYTNLKYKKQYLKSIKKVISKNNLDKYLLKTKIIECRYNLDLFTDLISLIKNNPRKRIFLSIDDKQFRGFKRLIGIFDGNKVKLVKEGKLKKGSPEYKMSLIIDTKLNIERNKRK